MDEKSKKGGKEQNEPDYEKMKAILDKLKQANLDGKDRNDEMVKALEVQLRKQLDISSDSWISSDKSLQELIKKLDGFHLISSELQARESLSDQMVLQKASGGLALRGILLTKSLEDLLKQRDFLLQLPQTVTLTGASQSEDKIANFASAHQEDSYKKKVDILGHSFAVTGLFPLDVFLVSVGLAASDKREAVTESQHHSHLSYLSTVRISTVQLASYSFSRSDMMLSKDAKDAMKKVSHMLAAYGSENGYVKDACKNFLCTYGSHADRGPFTFGGHYWQIYFSKGFSKEECETVKILQSNAISCSLDSLGISVNFKGGALERNLSHSKYQGKYSKSTLARTFMTTKMSGGPTEATDLAKWKSGIVANRSTWIVTDRGNELVPVWDIISEADYTNYSDLREVLKKAWEEVSGFETEHAMPKILLLNSDEVLKVVSEWRKKSLTAQKIKNCLEYLCVAKNSVMESTANRSIWIQDYLLQPPMQDFLMSLVDKTGELLFKDIKFRMKYLIEEEDCKQLNTQNFLGFEEIYHCLYASSVKPKPSTMGSDITSMENLDIFLKETLDKFMVASLKSDTSLFQHKELPDDIVIQIAQGIHWLQIYCKHTYDDVLITILVHPFKSSSDSSVIILRTLTVKDLQYMHKLFSEERLKLDKHNSPLLLQAYLFSLAMDVSCETKSLQYLLKKVAAMIRDLEPPLDPLLDELVSEVSSMGLLKEALQEALATGCLKHSTPENPKALRNALRTKALQHSLLSSENQFSTFQWNKEAKNLLEKMGLWIYYPQKLTLEDALCIRQETVELSVGNTHPTDPSQLPFLILQKIMAYDCTCRSDLMHPEQGKNFDESDESESDSSDTESDSSDTESDSSDTESDSSDTESSSDKTDKESANTSVQIHPVDALLAVLLCSDDFLRQDLYSRLAKCQLAVPFILPDPFTEQLTLPLWAMRSINKDFVAEGTKKTHPMVKYKMPIISFMRFGEHPPRCLSQLLNEVISGSSHNHFFHHDCRGGHYNQLLVDGLVDMSWYIPAGKKTDAFPIAITFLNLHGDARQHHQQRKFLCQISSMCFIHLTEKMELEDEILLSLKESGNIVFLNEVGKKPESLKKEGIKVHNIEMKSKNLAQVKDSISHRIRKLPDKDKLQCIEEHCSLESKGIIIDEERDSREVQCGLRLAQEVGNHISGDKSSMIPLQAYWKNWARHDRELYRQKGIQTKLVYKYTDEVREKKEQIRMEQLECAKALTPLMHSFIVALLKLYGPSNQIARKYFLQCLKMKLDMFSMGNVSEKQFLYHSTREELTKLSKAKGDDHKKEILRCKNQLKKHMQDITDASFGLEHLFREIGQIYEAAKSSSEFNEEVSCLPRVVAELLVEGHPFELMDGDVTHVPLTWVTAVINEAVKMLETVKSIQKPQIYTLSVLGIQSSGKSTMLNTVFGLQFNVSTGRCTRGAFMRLLPLDKNLQRKTNYSYVMIVDTEGLRAPELDRLTTQNHDNELATFVIGMANMTLINIMGEIAADIDDILQTSVHAFLRMNAIDLKPSCQFLHHNAEASKKNEVSRGNFTEKLNEITALAAKAEKLEGLYDSFSDVISFDEQKNIYYFPGLWKGDSLMDPVNQGYSDCAQQLKLSFIRSLQERESDITRNHHLSSFSTTLIDFWDALLKEDFVFSFRNTQEITAYTHLEEKYMQIQWKFKERMLEWEQKAENRISSAKKPSEVAKELLDDLNTYVSDEVKPLKESMENLFNDEWSEIVVKWKQAFCDRFNLLEAELEYHARAHCIKMEENKKAISSIEEERLSYTKKIKAKVQEVIESMDQEQDRFRKYEESLKRGRLTTEQLDELCKLELFTPENIRRYEKQGLLTADQVTEIDKILEQCGKKLSRDQFEVIISLLDKKMAKEILIEKQLEIKFDAIWIGLIGKFNLKRKDDIDITGQVENELRDFVVKYRGQLREKLKQKPLEEWGKFLELIPMEEVHYRKSTLLSKAFKYVTFQKSKHEIATKVTNKVLERAQKCIDEIAEKKDTDFNASYAAKLLREVDEELTCLESDEYKNAISFTIDYSIELYLVVSGHAIPMFKRMSESFRELHDPQVYLENNVKGPLCSDFISQFRRFKAEEAIAEKICACLKEPIRRQVNKRAAQKILDMLKSEQHFSSKMALKVKILSDIYRKDEFKVYMDYVVNVRRSTIRWLLKYIIHHCDMYMSNEGTRLQILLKNLVASLVSIVEDEVNAVQTIKSKPGDENAEDEVDAKDWLSKFCGSQRLQSELAVALEYSDFQKVKTFNYSSFKDQIETGLDQLKISLKKSFGSVKCNDELHRWEDTLLENLENLIGCTEQCPFCNEQCDLTTPNHYEKDKTEHCTMVHRLDCLGGYTEYSREDSDHVMALQTCPSLVAGTVKFKCKDTDEKWHNYKDYKSIYPEWSIPPDVTSQNSLYWKMIVGKYNKEIANQMNVKPADIPKGWEKIKWEDVKRNLKELYKYEAK